MANSLNAITKIMLYIYLKLKTIIEFKMQIKEIAQTFSLGQFSSVFQYFAEEIEWHIIGEQHIKGKENVITQCNLIQSHFNATPHQFTIHAQHQSLNTVIIQGSAEFYHANNNTIIQACDLYTFDHSNKLIRIESYCITS